MIFPSVDPAAIDDVDRAGGEGRVIAGEIERERGDLGRSTEPAHRLALDEAFERPLVIAGLAQPLAQRRGVDGTGADRVAANAMLDEVRGDRFGETNHRRL